MREGIHVENVYITIAGLVAIGLIFYAVRRAKRQDNTQTNLRITAITISPPPGSVLQANAPITVTMDYHYSAPGSRCTPG